MNTLVQTEVGKCEKCVYPMEPSVCVCVARKPQKHVPIMIRAAATHSSFSLSILRERELQMSRKRVNDKNGVGESQWNFSQASRYDEIIRREREGKWGNHKEPFFHHKTHSIVFEREIFETI